MFILAHHRDVPIIQLFAECLRKGLHSSLFTQTNLPLHRSLSLTLTNQVMSGHEMY